MQNILYNPKQFQFHSQFQPSSDSNILHTDNYMSRTRPPQNILHTQLTIPKIFQFLASNHFLTRYLHLHITRLVHTFPQASIFCLLSRRPTTENYAFSSPPLSPPQTQTNSPIPWSATLYPETSFVPRKPRYPTRWSATWPSIDRPRNVKIVRRSGISGRRNKFQRIHRHPRESWQDNVAKHATHRDSHRPTVTIREGLHAPCNEGGGGGMRIVAEMERCTRMAARRRGGQVCGSLRPPSCFAGTLHACCDNPWSGIQTFARSTSRKTTFPLVSWNMMVFVRGGTLGSVKWTFAKLARKADKTVR